MVTFRLGHDWVALPSGEVASLHWRGLIGDHRDPQTGRACLQQGSALVPLLDLQSLTGVTRRLVPEFVLVVRNAGVAEQPSRAGLLVDEFGEVVELSEASLPLPPTRPWWSLYLHADHGALTLTRHGPVPILSAVRLIAAATQWSASGSSW